MHMTYGRGLALDQHSCMTHIYELYINRISCASPLDPVCADRAPGTRAASVLPCISA